MLFLLFPLFVFAAGSEFVTKAGTATFHEVALASEASVKVGNENYLLTPIGHGLRYKKVVFVKADVYVAELFVSEPKNFSKSDPIGSLDKSKVVAMRLNFLRDVEAKKLEDAFRSACEGNGFDVNVAPLKDFLLAVKSGAGAKKGKALAVWGVQTAQGSKIFYQSSDAALAEFPGDKGFVRQIFSLWLGKAGDSGIEAMQKEILAH